MVEEFTKKNSFVAYLHTISNLIFDICTIDSAPKAYFMLQ